MKLSKLLILGLFIFSKIQTREENVWWKTGKQKPTGFSGINGQKVPAKYTEGEGYRAPASVKYRTGYSTSK